jgi:hypothetical protein
MIELILAAIVFVVLVNLYGQWRQQQAIGALFDMQPSVIQTAPLPERRLTQGEQRIMILIDDSDTLFRQILTRKPYSRAHCTARLGFSEYRWNRATKLLKHLGIFDGEELCCSYREARARIRKHFDGQMKLARSSSHFVPSI